LEYMQTFLEMRHDQAVGESEDGNEIGVMGYWTHYDEMWKPGLGVEGQG
jgi:hypothetical protein